MTPNDFPPVIEGLVYSTGGGFGFAFGFMVLKWGASFLASRQDAREAHLDAGQDKLHAGQDKLLEAVTKRLDKVTERLDTVEEELLECKRMHAESEADRLRLGALLQGMGDARQHAQLIIADEKQKERKA